jgi:CRP-like cAMP-binding protein
MDFGPGEVINEGHLVGHKTNYSVQVLSSAVTVIKISFENFLRFYKKAQPDLKLYSIERERRI